MTADWQRLKSVFQGALEKQAAERPAYLSEACGDDDALRRDVASLLASHDEAGEFLSQPALPETLGGGPEDAVLGEARHIGPYRLLDEIGQGGMGTVYRAVRDDDAFRKIVALKIVHGGPSDRVEQRFRRERQILAQLQHPNVVPILDGGTTPDGRPYLVMEYVAGEPITQYCDARGLSATRRLGIFRSVCAAVHYAHQNLVVHRDLKPANILVTADGTPQLLDFGIAKLLERADESSAPTATLLPTMTPEYASPEQVRGLPVTTASDVYSLGVLLYELLAGRRPYEVGTDSLEAIVLAVCEAEPPAPSAAAARAPASATHAPPAELRGDLDTIVLKALRKEPARRYASAHEL
jgi:serine/threonine protein kinase